jgi:hypothetical protein
MSQNREITNVEFDRILTDILDERPASELLSVSGVYEALVEEFNNEILRRWRAEEG